MATQICINTYIYIHIYIYIYIYTHIYIQSMSVVSPLFAPSSRDLAIHLQMFVFSALTGLFLTNSRDLVLWKFSHGTRDHFTFPANKLI